MKSLTILIVTLSVCLAACAPTGKVAQEDTIKIGVIAPLTGDSALIGLENLHGMQIAAAEINRNGGINGQNIELVVKDDQLNEKEALTQYQQLVDVHDVDYILTTTYGSFLAIAPRGDQTVVISSLDSSEELANAGPNAFAIGLYDESIGNAIADYIAKEDGDSIGLIVNQEDPFMQLVEDTIKKRFAGKIAVEHYTFETADWRTPLTKLAKKDFIVVAGFDETGRLVKQAKQLGITAPIIGIDTFMSENFRENAGDVEGLRFTYWQGAQENAQYKAMHDAYQETFGKAPDNALFVAVGHDALAVLASGIEQCNDEVRCVSSYLRNDVKAFPGVTGPVTVDSDGVTRSVKETIYQYQDGVAVQLE